MSNKHMFPISVIDAERKASLAVIIDGIIENLNGEMASRIESGDVDYSIKLLDRISKLEQIKDKIESFKVD